MPVVAVNVFDKGAFSNLAKNLRGFARDLESGDFSTELREIVLQILLEDLRDNISYITDRDGNLAGSQEIIHTRNISVIRWTGDQIRFLEFGTGTQGVNQPYPGQLMNLIGYDPVDHSWSYWDRETASVKKTDGIPAYAPMYKVFLHAGITLSKGDLVNRVKIAVEWAMRENGLGR